MPKKSKTQQGQLESNMLLVLLVLLVVVIAVLVVKNVYTGRNTHKNPSSGLISPKQE